MGLWVAVVITMAMTLNASVISWTVSIGRHPFLCSNHSFGLGRLMIDLGGI